MLLPVHVSPFQFQLKKAATAALIAAGRTGWL
jgi:hypothetical protein